MENMNRRSFFGVLGGALTAATVVGAGAATALAQGSTNPTDAGWPEKGNAESMVNESVDNRSIRIDEWDEDRIHMIHITTKEDVDMGVGFDSAGGRSLLTPLRGSATVIEAQVNLKTLNLKGRYATIVVHESPNQTKVGRVITPYPLEVANMRLNLPVRFI